ncbi:MAG TPA: hypothetical protein VF941_09220 [Clostridia bacterium]
MDSNFTLENDKLRVIASLFWMGGAITLLITNLRTFRKDYADNMDCNDVLKCEIEKMEKQLQKLKSKL